MFHLYPQFLPGGKQFLYVIRYVEAEKMGIYMGSLDGKPGTPETRIAQTEYKAEYDAGSGRLLYMQGAGVLMAQRLELDPPRLTGDPATVAEGVRNVFNNGYASFRFLRMAGCLRAGERGRKGAIRMAGPGGQAVGNDWPAGGGKIQVQPIAGRKPGCLQCGPGLGQGDIWVLELAGGRSTRVTFSNATRPRWSPDGKQLYYSNSGGIHRKAADGSGEEALLMKGAEPISCKACRPTARFCCMEVVTS